MSDTAFNPYSVLGVKRGATFEQIKRAFRKLARKFHPDAPGGGDREAFQSCQRALEILTDETRRKRYDETGDPGDPGNAAEAFDAQAVALLVNVLAEIVFGSKERPGLVHGNRSLVGIDLVALMRQRLNEIKLNAKKGAAEAPAMQERVDFLAKRFKTKGDGPNPLRSMLEREGRVDQETDRGVEGARRADRARRSSAAQLRVRRHAAA